jgi:hypothetical protein
VNKTDLSHARCIVRWAPANAAEFKKRATLRIGELMAERRAARTLAKGGATKGTKRLGPGGKVMRGDKSPALPLAAEGVDKDLAKEARRLAGC